MHSSMPSYYFFRPLVLTPSSDPLDLTSSTSSSTIDCRALLWYSAVLLLAVLALFYYFYVVHELVQQLKLEARWVGDS